jgi:hypothetical protein
VAIGTVGTVVYAWFRDFIVIPRSRRKLDLRFGRSGNDQIVVATGGGFDATSESQPVGLPLTWSGTSPPRTVASVHPGSERHIDLLHVDWPGRDEGDIARKWTGVVPLHLDLTPTPAGGQGTLTPDAYEISVELRARNADAIRYVIDVVWDGAWSGKAAMWEHLRVESPRKVR